MSSDVFNRVIALILLIVAIALAWRAVNGENLSFGLPFWNSEASGDSVETVLRNAGRGLERLAPSQPPRPTPTFTPEPPPIPAGW
ncbi:MAG: hypothetical protein ACTS2F_23305 [Thainema sp.]